VKHVLTALAIVSMIGCGSAPPPPGMCQSADTCIDPQCVDNLSESRWPHSCVDYNDRRGWCPGRLPEHIDGCRWDSNTECFDCGART
jgi:hypothetical protein